MDNERRIGAALTETIQAAFEGVEREDGVSISEAHAIDAYASEEKLRAARRADPSGPWEELPPDHVEDGAWAMAFLDAKGLRYYLPAFMVRALKSADDSDLPQALIALLSNPPETDERFELLSVEQRRAVCLFLQLHAGEESHDCDEIPSARRCLDRGWSRYC